MRILVSVLMSCVAATASGQCVSTVAGPIDAAGGMTVGPDGNLYVGNFGDSLTTAGGTEVWKVTPDGDVSLFGEVLVGATGNGWDSGGNFYQADIGAGAVWKFAPDGSRSRFAEVVSPVGLAIDAHNNVFVTSCELGLINRITPSGTVTEYARDDALLCPNGLAIDPAGNLYTVNFRDGGVFEIGRDRNVVEIARTPGSATRPNGGNGHVVYAQGRLFVTSNATDQIFEIRRNGQMEVLAGNGTRGHEDGATDEAMFSFPNGIAISRDKRILYVNESVSTELVGPDTFKLTPSLIRAISLSPPFTAEPGESGCR